MLLLFPVCRCYYGRRLCSTLGDDTGGRLGPPRTALGWVREVSPKFWKFYMPNGAFWGILNWCDNWSTEWVQGSIDRGRNLNL